MSRSRTDGWSRWMGRALQRTRGRAPRHTLYLQAQGLQSWRVESRGGAEAVPAAFPSFDAWCATHEGADAGVYVSGHLLHSLIVDPALALTGDGAVRSYARQQFSHYHGAPAQDWSLAAWSGDHGAGACALHALDLAALQDTATKHHVRLRSVAPAWSAGLNSLAAFKPSFAAHGARALALVEGSLLTWLAVDAGRIVALQQRFLGAPSIAALAALLDAIVGESEPLAGPPLVIGWGLEDGAPAVLPGYELLGSLDHRGAATRWMLDTIGADA